MKKDLRHIFDRASASELENLIDQNKAPEISSDTLDSIQSKVYAKTRISKVKTKKPLVFHWKPLAATAACIFLAFGMMFGVYAMKENFVKANGWRDPTGWIGIDNVMDQNIEEPFSWEVDLNKNPDVLLQDFEGKDVVIQKDGVVVQGRELWNDFYKKTQDHQPSKIKIAYYSTKQDGVSELFLREISFDGEQYKQDTVQALNLDYRDIRIYTDLCKFEGVYQDSADIVKSYEYEDYVLMINPIHARYNPNDSSVISAWSGCNDYSVVCKFRSHI